MREQASFRAANNATVDLNGNFAFAQTEDSKWQWGTNCTLKMSGDGASVQSLEIGGVDLGTDPGGFNDNFDLENLQLEGSGTYVYLADSIVNLNDLSDEALYVDHLEVGPGTTLNVSGLNLYAYLGGAPHLVIAGEGGLLGGGAIIDDYASIPVRDIVVEPSPPDFDFGVVGIGETSIAEHVRLRNKGGGAILISAIIPKGDEDF
jgi:hypothetical protein